MPGSISNSSSQSAPNPPQPLMQQLVSFLRFAGLSGMGWLLDLTVLVVLVGSFQVPAFAANVVSSSIAALSVFLLSRYLVFKRDERALGVRIAIYMGYTLCVILVAAAALRGVIGILAGIPLTQHYSATVLAGIAKVIITPPQLLLNFVVARATSERPVSAP